MKKLLAFFLLLSCLSNVQPCTLRSSPALHRLLDHFQSYRLTALKKKNFHAGDLLQHSIWSCKSLAQWFDEKKAWVEGLHNHRDIIILGALLHDIGKAGDQEFFYTSKRSHPCDGFDYLWHQDNHPFKLEDGSQFDFNELYSELNISDEEQQMLAIFIAMHWDFGLIMKNVRSNPKTTLEQECKVYLAKLAKYCQHTGFNNGKPTEALLRACIAVSAADVRGVQPNNYTNGTLITLLGTAMATSYNKPCYNGFDAYATFKIEEEGLPIREKLCSML